MTLQHWAVLFSKLEPLLLTSRRYLLSDLPVWKHNVHPSLRFQQQLFTAFPLKSPAACLRLVTDSPALQSCRACDRLKFQAAPASGDFVEGWIGYKCAKVTLSNTIIQSKVWMPVSTKYATQLLWKAQNGHISLCLSHIQPRAPYDLYHPYDF